MKIRAEKINKRYITVFALQMLLCLILLRGCFDGEQAICSVTGLGLGQGTAVYNGMEYRITGLELTPGVYQIRLQCDPQQNQGMYAEVYADASYYKSLLGNGVSVFAETDYIDFEVYVTDKIADVGVRLEIYGDGDPAAALELLEVYRTPMGSRMLLVLAVLIFTILDALMIWRGKILAGQVTTEQQLVVWGLIGVMILSVLPELANYFLGDDDLFFHLLRIESLKETLQNGGSLPVRIQDYWLYGHGYAVSFSYGDLFILLPALLRLLGFPMLFAYHFLVLVFAAATYLIFYGSAVQCVKDRKAAVFGAVLYSLAPYRLMDLFTRAALGEYLAMTFLPLTVAGIYLLLTGDPGEGGYKKYKWYLIAGISSVLYCHILSTEFVLIALTACCIVFWKRTFRRGTILQLAQGAGITLALTCWYWLPMISLLSGEQLRLTNSISKYVQQNGTYLSQQLQFLPNSGHDILGVQSGRIVQMGAAIAAGVVLMLLYRAVKKERLIRAEKILIGFIAGVLFIASVYFPWDSLHDVPVIGALSSSWQFPLRWIMVASLLGAVLVMVVYKKWMTENRFWRSVVPCFVIVVAVGSALYQVNYISQTSASVYLYSMENMGTISVEGGEYLLKGSTEEDYYQHLPVAEEGLTYTDYEKQGLRIRITLSNPTDQELSLELPLTGYKGYTVESTETGDGETEVRIAGDRGAHGDLKLIVPAGYEGTVCVRYQESAFFRAAEMISLITFAWLMVYEVLQWRRKSLAARESLSL